MKKSLLVVELQEPHLGQAPKTAIEKRIPIYDTLFIAQAVKKRATLITSDKGQYELAEGLGVEAVYV